MFERNKVDFRAEPKSVPVELELTDGGELKGKLLVPANQAPLDVLNGSGGFVEFVPYSGEPRYLAKSTIAAIRLVGVPRQPHLAGRTGSSDEFDPYGILGVSRESCWDEVRAAYLQLSKAYHPDRYSSAMLPAEVGNYLESMARRVNAAYAALEIKEKSARMLRAELRPAVYTSRNRG